MFEGVGGVGKGEGMVNVLSQDSASVMTVPFHLLMLVELLNSSHKKN